MIELYGKATCVLFGLLQASTAFKITTAGNRLECGIGEVRLRAKVYLISKLVGLWLYMSSIVNFLAAWDVFSVLDSRWKLYLIWILGEAVPALLISRYIRQKEAGEELNDEPFFDGKSDIKLSSSYYS